MSRRGTIGHMFMVAKKKPALQAAIDNIDMLTESEINAMVEYQVWIRKHLLSIKKAKEEEILKAEKEKADDELVGGLNIPAAASEVYPSNEVYRYTGGDVVINASGTNAFAFDVSSNDVFMVIDDEYLKINSVAIKCVGKDRETLKNNSIFVDRKTITEYNAYLQEILNAKHFGTLEDDRNGPGGWMSGIRIY